MILCFFVFFFLFGLGGFEYRPDVGSLNLAPRADPPVCPTPKYELWTCFLPIIENNVHTQAIGPLYEFQPLNSTLFYLNFSAKQPLKPISRFSRATHLRHNATNKESEVYPFLFALFENAVQKLFN